MWHLIHLHLRNIIFAANSFWIIRQEIQSQSHTHKHNVLFDFEFNKINQWKRKTCRKTSGEKCFISKIYDSRVAFVVVAAAFLIQKKNQNRISKMSRWSMKYDDFQIFTISQLIKWSLLWQVIYHRDYSHRHTTLTIDRDKQE